MYDYNEQILEYQKIKVNIPKEIRELLKDHRKINQDRLMNNIPENIAVNRSSFIKQGSYAMRTIIQEINNEYDIDDGVALKLNDLVNEKGDFLKPVEVKKIIKKTLTDKRFNKLPKILNNCVRVFYEAGHHVDIPVYRKYKDDYDNEIQEIASIDEWKESYPTRINSWFEDFIIELNGQVEGAGSQLRRMVRLLKRFTKSRGNKWDMPSGIKLTMLVAECFRYFNRDDEAFYYLLESLQYRLKNSQIVENLADDSLEKEKLTKTSSDENMLELREKIGEALEELNGLFEYDCTIDKARIAWDWVFQPEGFFDAFDKNSDLAKSHYQKDVLIKAGIAATTQSGIITSGISYNPKHKWYGEKKNSNG